MTGEELKILPRKGKLCEIGHYLVSNSIKEIYEIIQDIERDWRKTEIIKQKDKLTLLSSLANAIKLKDIVCREDKK